METAAFMPGVEVEAMLKEEKKKAIVSTFRLDLKPHYWLMLQRSLIQQDTGYLNSISLMEGKEISINMLCVSSIL